MSLSREYPKWVHCPGHASVVVNDADAEAAQLAEWGAVTAPVEDPAPVVAAVVETPPAPPAKPVATPPITPPASNLGDWDGDGPPGGSVASIKPANALTTPAQPKRAGGWPKGKPRTGNRH